MCDVTIANICLEFYFVLSTLQWIVLSDKRKDKRLLDVCHHLVSRSAILNTFPLTDIPNSINSELILTQVRLRN